MPWASNVTLEVEATTPSNRSLAPPLDVVFVMEANAGTSQTLERFAKLVPGVGAQVTARDPLPGTVVSAIYRSSTGYLAISQTPRSRQKQSRRGATTNHEKASAGGSEREPLVRLMSVTKFLSVSCRFSEPVSTLDEQCQKY